MSRIHLIAIGGSVMHNLALELQAQGHYVTGSDDQIYDPAHSRLDKAGLLPDRLGWYESRIEQHLDMIILGMHAHADNPELKKAQELKLKIQSFPEFISGQLEHCHRIIVAGSHGKTTTTSMIMHVLRKLEVDFNYMVGGIVPGFDRMVRLNPSARLAVLEGDEYLSSRLDPTPKMLHYKGHIVIVTGMAWDHINVFPTEAEYAEAFAKLVKEPDHLEFLIYDKTDDKLHHLIQTTSTATQIPYSALEITGDQQVIINGQVYPVGVFGKHNAANLHAALLALGLTGISESQFFKAIKDFTGVGKRLERICDKPPVYRDFAHAPSKVSATVRAVRSRYPHKRLLAVAELHTYSSLNKTYLPGYKGTLDAADRAIIFYDPKAIEIKRLESLKKDYVELSFDHKDLSVCQTGEELQNMLLEELTRYDVILVMGSGNLAGINVLDLISLSNS